MIQEVVPPSSVNPQSIFDFIVAGGPLMVPIGLCSIVALAFVIERTLRLREGELGSRRYAKRISDALASGGATEALEVCQKEEKPLGRVLSAGLRRFPAPRVEVEKAVEDAGAREVKRLSANLRPLVVCGVVAPLLGLLGTVWGIILAFAEISQSHALGRPGMLANGIYQALITTAAGLVVAIPTQTAYFWFRGRIDRFVRRVEEIFDELETRLEGLRAPRLEPQLHGASEAGGAA